ncbi:MAG: L,D-transpeptidase [Alphaproteobacteria bacterium]|nr:L,D-transpeptidase [Alphaproteobacteria bacterium]
MKRRDLLLGLASVFASGVSASAASASTRFNFTSAFSTDLARQKPRPVAQQVRSERPSSYEGKELVSYDTAEEPGTIIVDTGERALFLVLEDGEAMRYGVGVGRAGFAWKGAAHIKRKAKWPAWYPTENMRRRAWKKNRRRLPKMVKGGPKNPLGARALYLYQGNRDTLYRIHGTNNPASIGHARSSGCIRLLNEEIIDLHKRAQIGAKVIVI